MKRIKERITTILLISLICFNVIFPSMVYSADLYGNNGLDVNSSEKVTIEQAIELFKIMLNTEKEAKEKELGNIDEYEKTIQLISFFQELKSKHVSATGEFYEDTLKLAQKITPQSDKEEFLGDVPQYIQGFVTNLNNTEINPVTMDYIWGFFSFTIDAIAGIILYIPKLLVIIGGAIIQVIETLISIIGSENGMDKLLSIDHIFFNEVPLVDINIFDFQNAANSTISVGNVLLKFRENIASWYYAIRNLAIVFSLAVLVYIGIRMAISAVADEKAKYKKMFKDWFVSFALIFVLQYLMIFVIQTNNNLVEILAENRLVQMQENKLITPIPLQTRLLEVAFSPMLVRGVGATILYVMLVAMTFLFLIVYIKRLITISFLAIISPLITVTYAIDKAGDGKAQALNKWLKEFIFNVLIQPFHCIIYLVFLDNIFSIINNTAIFNKNGITMLSTGGALHFGKIVVALIILGFIYKAEDIVKAIFGFQANNLSSAAMLGAMAVSKVGKVKNMATTYAGIKDASGKAKKVKNVDTPNELPSQAANNNVQKPTTNNNTGANTQPSSQKTTGKFANSMFGKTIAGVAKWGAGKTGRKIATRALGAAIGYGLTGEYGGAIAGDKTATGIKKKADEMRLASRVKEKKERALDAYQDYKENHGLSSEEMIEKSKELLNTDINDITDAEERNLAQHLQGYKETQKILGIEEDDKASSAVMKELYKYEKMDV